MGQEERIYGKLAEVIETQDAGESAVQSVRDVFTQELKRLRKLSPDQQFRAFTAIQFVAAGKSTEPEKK